MRKPNCWFVLAVGIAGGVAVQCAKRVPVPDEDRPVVEMSKAEFMQLSGSSSKAREERTERIHPGDELAVSIYDKLPVSQEKREIMGRVDEDGTLFLLPAGKITIAGLSAFEAQSEIEAALSEYVVSPHCEVRIVKRAYQPMVYVFGAVGGAPGVGGKGTVPLRPGDRLLDVLAQVGGVSDDAYGRSVKVIRVHEQKVAMISVSLADIMRRGQVNQNVPLRDQDIVFVPRRFYTGFREVMSVLGTLLPWYYFANNFL